jgi:threonine dehydratase
VGVEPESGNDAYRSLIAKEPISIPVPHTIADGLQLPAPGRVPFEIMKDRVSEIILVTDDEIVDAMRFLFERMKLVVEPSGAASLAALLAHKVSGAEGKNIAAILSGGNVGAARFSSLMTGAEGAS